MVAEYSVPSAELAEAVMRARLAPEVAWTQAVSAAEGLSHGEIARACEQAAKNEFWRTLRSSPPTPWQGPSGSAAGAEPLRTGSAVKGRRPGAVPTFWSDASPTLTPIDPTSVPTSKLELAAGLLTSRGTGAEAECHCRALHGQIDC